MTLVQIKNLNLQEQLVQQQVEVQHLEQQQVEVQQAENDQLDQEVILEIQETLVNHENQDQEVLQREKIHLLKRIKIP